MKKKKFSYSQTTKKVMNRNFRVKPCRHYWLIEAPAGRISQGVCKYCGEQQGFSNITDNDTKTVKVRF